MDRKNISITDKTKGQLKEIESINGARHSATIRIAVDEYYAKTITDITKKPRQWGNIEK